jgi:hypothetical protein
MSDLLFPISPTPHLQDVIGTLKWWESTNSKPPEPIKPSHQSIEGVRLCSPFAATASYAKMLAQNHFYCPKLA